MLKVEHELIPFDVSPLPPGPWLVFAPHADDETFGMGGALLRAKHESVATHLVVLTDGALGGDREDLVSIRDQEVNKAAELLGLNSLQSWGEPDRGLEFSQGLQQRVVETIATLNPAAVFFPAPLEIHPDHRAAAFIVWEGLQQAYQQNHKPEIIAYEIGVQSPINFFLDITPVVEEKEQVMAVYASQNDENNYPELVLALNKGRTFSLAEHIKFAEGFYRFDEADLQVSLREMTHRLIDRYQ